MIIDYSIDIVTFVIIMLFAKKMSLAIKEYTKKNDMIKLEDITQSDI